MLNEISTDFDDNFFKDIIIPILHYCSFSEIQKLASVYDWKYKWGKKSYRRDGGLVAGFVYHLKGEK